QRDQLAAPEYAKRLAYWTGRLSDLPELELPGDRPRAANPTGAGGSYVARMPGGLGTDARALATAEGVRLHTVLLAGFAALLCRYTGQDDVVLGSVFGGRTRSEIEPLVGFFVNTLVLRLDLAGEPTFREVIARAEEALLGAHDHQDVPFDQVVA